MNPRLKSALSSLKQAGAQGLPTGVKVETAKDKTSWNGKKTNGDPWTLIKNNGNSYNCIC